MKIHFDEDKFKAWADKQREEMPEHWEEGTRVIAIVNDAAELYLKKMRQEGQLDGTKCVFCGSQTKSKSAYGSVTVNLCVDCREPLFCLFFRQFS
jgi:hypothetical protein